MAKGDLRDDEPEVKSLEERFDPVRQAIARGTFQPGDPEIDKVNPAFERLPETPPPKPPEPTAPSQEEINKMISQREDIIDQQIGTVKSAGEKTRAELLTPLPHPPLPQYQNIPKPPQQQYANVFKDSGPGLIFATLFGALATRAHGMGALSAATGYMQGFREGDEDKMRVNRQNWQDNVEAVIKQNNVQHERYQAIWDDHRLSQADKQARINAYASEVGDAQTIAAMKNGQMDFAYGLHQDRYKAAQHMEDIRARYGGAERLLNEQDLQGLVDRRLAGDKSVLTNLGRGAQGPQNVVAFNRALNEEMRRRKMTGADLLKKDQQAAGEMAYQRTAATMGARVETATNEVRKFIPIALQASRELPRGQWVPLNELLQRFQKGESLGPYYRFAAANFALKSQYMRMVNPQGVPRVQEREEAKYEGILNMASSPQAYEQILRMIWIEGQASKEAVLETQQGRQPANEPFPGDRPAAGAPGPGGGGGGQLAPGWSGQRVQ